MTYHRLKGLLGNSKIWYIPYLFSLITKFAAAKAPKKKRKKTPSSSGSEADGVLSKSLFSDTEDYSEESITDDIQVPKNSENGSQDLPVSDDPMDFENDLEGMWVVVKYGGKQYIGNVQEKVNGPNGPKYNVKCLEYCFGDRRPQTYEKGESIFFDEVFETDAAEIC